VLKNKKYQDKKKFSVIEPKKLKKKYKALIKNKTKINLKILKLNR